jgi:hypothetical protein
MDLVCFADGLDRRTPVRDIVLDRLAHDLPSIIDIEECI